MKKRKAEQKKGSELIYTHVIAGFNERKQQPITTIQLASLREKLMRKGNEKK